MLYHITHIDLNQIKETNKTRKVELISHIESNSHETVNSFKRTSINKSKTFQEILEDAIRR